MSLALNSGVSITPRHFFGVNHEIKNSLFLVDDNTLIYPAGHTVVSNKIQEENAPQYFFPGTYLNLTDYLPKKYKNNEFNPEEN